MTQNEIKARITNNVIMAIEKGNLAFPNKKIKFENIEIRFTLRGTTGGKAQYINDSNMKLWFHLELAKRNINDYDDTIIHEIAHLYQRKMYPYSQPHGREFKMIARKLGGSATRCHSMNTKGLKQERILTRYVYTCKQCGRDFYFTKAKHDKQKTYSRYDPTGKSGYACGYCGKHLEFTGEIREFSNITGKVVNSY